MEPEVSLPHSHRLPPVPILGQPNPVHIPTIYLLEIQPNMIHPSTPTSLQWSLSLRLLVVLYGFSKFVVFYLLIRVSSQVVVDCLERNYFPIYGTPHAIFTDNATVFRCKRIKPLCLGWV
jgi:hypothetical protein